MESIITTLNAKADSYVCFSQLAEVWGDYPVFVYDFALPECPNFAWMCLNSNGGDLSSIDGKAACGGVMQDHNGTFVFDFSASLSLCSVVMAKLWAIV